MFLNIFLICFLITACETSKKSASNFNNEEILFGVQIEKVHTLVPCTLNIFQMDSMLQTDKLPKLNKWTKNPLTDEETKVLTNYMTLYDRTSNIVYTIKEMKDGKFVVSKKLINGR